MDVIERLEELGLFNQELKSCPVLAVTFKCLILQPLFSPVSTEDG